MSPHSTGAGLPTVVSGEEIRRYDCQLVNLRGVYRAVVMPSKRPAPRAVPKEYAVLELDDKTEVFIGIYNTAEARRDESELIRFDEKYVSVTGEVYSVMPGVGQAPRKPCISKVSRIEEAYR